MTFKQIVALLSGSRSSHPRASQDESFLSSSNYITEKFSLESFPAPSELSALLHYSGAWNAHAPQWIWSFYTIFIHSCPSSLADRFYASQAGLCNTNTAHAGTLLGIFFIFFSSKVYFYSDHKLKLIISNEILTSRREILWSKNCWFKCRNLGKQEWMHCHVSDSESWRRGLWGDRTAFPLGPTSICWSMGTTQQRSTQAEEWDRGVGKKAERH